MAVVSCGPDTTGVDASAAVVASVTAEPIAQSLLLERLPAAVRREKERLAHASDVFVETDRTVTRISMMTFLVSALFGGTLAVVLLRDVFRSIEGLKSGARKIGAGELDHRIESRSEDELAEVAESFNQMADQLSQRTHEMERQRALRPTIDSIYGNPNVAIDSTYRPDTAFRRDTIRPETIIRHDTMPRRDSVIRTDTTFRRDTILPPPIRPRPDTLRYH